MTGKESSDDIVIIIRKDFCNMENHYPESETVIGFVKNETEAVSAIGSISGEKYEGWDGNTYPVFYTKHIPRL